MKVRAHLYIKGRVQGVGYRAFAVRTAGMFGLSGWVRNLPDRSVEAALEGDRPTVEAAIKIFREGPPASNVSALDVSWSTATEGLSSFSIKY
jgi:acylphosphatase